MRSLFFAFSLFIMRLTTFSNIDVDNLKKEYYNLNHTKQVGNIWNTKNLLESIVKVPGQLTFMISDVCITRHVSLKRKEVIL